MSGGSAAPPPVPQAPNYGPVLEATQAQIAYQREAGAKAQKWAEDQYYNNKPYADTVKDKLIKTLNENTSNAQEDRARYKNVYQPLENQIIGEASGYDTPERRAKARARAEAGVAQSFDAASASATRELERYGADPTSVRYGALDLGSKLMRATAGAAASDKADIDTEQTGINYRLQAANMGKGLPAQAIAGYQTGTQAGTGAANVGAQNIATSSGSLGNPMGWNSGVNQSIGTWGNMLGQQYETSMKGYDANLRATAQSNSEGGGGAQALGMVAGLGGMLMMSDERAKDGMKEIGQTKEGQPIYRYRLKGSNKTQIGLSAQETQKRHPDAVAEGPDGLLRVDYDRATRGAVDMAGGGSVDETGYLDPSMSPSDGEQVDDIEGTGPGGGAVNLNAGEFVMPADVVAFRGQQWMQKQVQKARTEMGDPHAGREAAPTVKRLPHPSGVPLPTQMAGGGMVRGAPYGRAVPRGVNFPTGEGAKPPAVPHAPAGMLRRMPGADSSPMKSAVRMHGFR